MTAIVRKITQTFTDSTLPVLLPAFGITGATLRWDADLLTGADNTAVASWSGAIGGVPLAGGGNTGGPTLQTMGDGHRFLRFNDTNLDYLRDPGSGISGQVKALCVLARTPVAATNSGYISTGASYYRGLSNTQFELTGGGGSASPTSSARTPDKWSLRWLIHDGTNRVFLIGTSQRNTAATTTTITKLEVGRTVVSGLYGPLDVAQIVAFNRVPTTGEYQSAYDTWAAARPTWAA